ncbi:2TM domain-containing protein [Desulfarculales bacterium]
MTHDPKHNHDQPEGGATGLKKLMFISLGVLVLLNVLIPAPHPHFALEKLPGFWALFALIWAVVLGKVAKGTAHIFLGKDEDYYEKRD